MKKTHSFLFTAGLVLAMAFTFSCSSDDGNNEPKPYVNAEFSVVPPESWQAVDYPGLKYKVFMGPRENGTNPNIMFADEIYNGSLDDYVDLYVEALKTYLSDVEIIYRGSFVTLKNLESKKVISITEQRGYLLRQSQYFFPGENGLKIVAACTALASSGEKIFDDSMKTFEWIK